MTRLGPIRDDELDHLFSACQFETLVLAVSGGPDSLALLVLASSWCKARGRAGPNIVVATVDHGLRPESREEADRVATVAASHGLRHRTLVWAGDKPVTAIQAQARQARYRLLAGLAQQFSRPAIVTAHTLDDQAETMLMRLGRGSGVDGLAAMNALQPVSAILGPDPFAADVPVCRPLLPVPKARLVETLRCRGIAWIEDPSNRNPAFERVRLREATPALQSVGLCGERLALAARRLGRARSALEAVTGRLWHDLVDLNGGAFARMPRSAMGEQPAELRIRILRRALQAFGGSATPVPLEKAERLDAVLSDPDGLPVTIAGCRVEVRGDSLLVWREAGRQGLPTIELTAGDRLIWDGRFTVTAPRNMTRGWWVAPFDPAGLDETQRVRLRNSKIPRRIARTLPAVWKNGKIVFVPVVGIEFSTAVEASEPCPDLTFVDADRR